MRPASFLGMFFFRIKIGLCKKKILDTSGLNNIEVYFSQKLKFGSVMFGLFQDLNPQRVGE